MNGKLLGTRKWENFSLIELSLSQEITITESFIPPFSLISFMADIGGSLGLWLGGGAVQLVTSAWQLLQWISKC